MIEFKHKKEHLRAHTFRMKISGINGSSAGFGMLHIAFESFPGANDVGLQHQQL
jgi:hypothetical protein